jgi:hypothetical protein
MKQLILITVLVLSLFANAANEIFFHSTPGQTNLKVSITNPATQAIWDGDSFEANPDWSARSNGVTENANDPGMYYASMPAGVTDAGVYLVRVWDSVNGTLDSTDPHIMTFTIDWGGTSEVWNKDLKDDTETLITGVNVATVGGDLFSEYMRKTEVFSSTLSADAEAGDTTIAVTDTPSGWSPGDILSIMGDGLTGMNLCSIKAVTDNTVDIVPPIQYTSSAVSAYPVKIWGDKSIAGVKVMQINGDSLTDIQQAVSDAIQAAVTAGIISEDVAAAILAVPANKLATDSSGRVTTRNMGWNQ